MNDQHSNDPKVELGSDEAKVDSAPASEAPSALPRNPRRTRFAAAQWLGKSLLRAAVPIAVFIGCMALLGVAQRTGWIRNEDYSLADAGEDHDHDGATVYTCPMHPQIRQNGPGKCPICAMKLVPAAGKAGAQTAAGGGGSADRFICPMKCTPPSSEPGRCPVCAMELVPTASGGGGDGLSVTIEPAARRLIGIQTAKAELGAVSQTIRTIGAIDYDESKLATISAYVGGRIEKLYANYVGVPVERDDDLALIYSPDLYSAQVEYLTALRGSGLKRLGGDSNLAELAEQNLIELGFTEDQVVDLRTRGRAESRVRMRSPIKGTVIGKFAVEGDYLKTGDEIYRIADLSTVWLMLDLYPEDAARIRFGQQVEAEVQSVPGEVFTGRVAFIDPTVSSSTRTVQVRVEMLNPDGKLRPGDYATARVYVPAIRENRVYDPALAGKYISPMHPQVIRAEPGVCPICDMNLIPTSQLGYASEPLPEQQVVTIPRNAVLMTGESSVVYVESDPGRFEIRRVSVGPMNDDRAVILEGISSGETVATNGNFLIDSQMQLAGNPSLMDPSKAPIYRPGPLEIPSNQPLMLAGESAQRFDQALEAYFAIQQSLADDQTPPTIVVDKLLDALDQLSGEPDIPNDAKRYLQRAQQSLGSMTGSVQEVRKSFRPLSHSLLRAAMLVRGEQKLDNYVHMYCSKVPGGGGDWMQAEGVPANPYLGSEMPFCGELVGEMGVGSGERSVGSEE